MTAAIFPFPPSPFQLTTEPRRVTPQEINDLHHWDAATVPSGLFLETDQVDDTDEECLIGRTEDGTEYVTIAQRVRGDHPVAALRRPPVAMIEWGGDGRLHLHDGYGGPDFVYDDLRNALDAVHVVFGAMADGVGEE